MHSALSLALRYVNISFFTDLKLKVNFINLRKKIINVKFIPPVEGSRTGSRGAKERKVEKKNEREGRKSGGEVRVEKMEEKKKIK